MEEPKKLTILPLLEGIVLILLFVGTLSYVAEHLRNPCTTPVTWKLGTVDTQFGISRSDVINDATFATNLWNKAHPDNKLLTYDEHNPDVTVNLIYDERMRTTIRLAKLKQTIEMGKETVSTSQTTLESLRATYDTLSKTIDADKLSYQSRLDAYNAQVTYWNGNGGAPHDTYVELQQTQASLEKERIALNEKIAQYNDLGKTLKTDINNHNDIVQSLNTSIDAFNTVGTREFEEGVYDGAARTITIYEYDSRTALKRVLAHEFGHALSLDHVNDRQSIMYPLNIEDTLTLGSGDLDELKALCSQKSLLDIARNYLFIPHFGTSK